MSEFSIKIDVSQWMPPNTDLTRNAFPNLAFTVERVAQAAAEIWQGYASGDKALPNGKIIHSRTGAYMRSIKVRSLSDYSAEAYSDSPYAEAIESGQEPRDLKRMLDSSTKVRVSKAGKRYLIIPFRHGTPGAVGFSSTMSDPIYQLARSLSTSRILSQYSVPSPLHASDARSRQPMMVTRRKYRWGNRLTQDALRAAGARGRQLRNMSGMVHMQNPTGGHGSYLTFRVMAEDSSGWITQGTEGKYPARATSQKILEVAERQFRSAVSRDIAEYLGATG